MISQIPIESLNSDIIKQIIIHSTEDQLALYAGVKRLFKYDGTEDMPTLYYVEEFDGQFSIHAIDVDMVKYLWLHQSQPVPPTTIKLTYSSDKGDVPEMKEVELVDGEYKLTSEDLPELESEGFEFKGWFINGVQAEVDTVVTEDTELIASWEAIPETITLSYSSGYGEAPESKEVELTEGIYTLTADDLVQLEVEGYTFNGWLINGELAEVGTEVSEDTELVASWASV